VNDDLITAAEAAARLGVPKRTLLRWAKVGLVPAVKLPGRTGAYLFDPADINQLTNRGTL
jgi:excisionase family DNA binding protein